MVDTCGVVEERERGAIYFQISVVVMLLSLIFCSMIHDDHRVYFLSF